MINHRHAGFAAVTLLLAAGIAARADFRAPAPQTALAASGSGYRAGQAAKDTRSGQMLFKTFCASCHGTSARGDGPMAGLLRVAPPDLTRIAIRNGGAFPAERVYRIIDGRAAIGSHGTLEMPVWGNVFASPAEGGDAVSVATKIRDLVSYLEAIQERRAE
jgi:mono/diheme cytochrome c family protein